MRNPSLLMIPSKLSSLPAPPASPKVSSTRTAIVLASLRPIEREIGKYRKYERIFHPLRFLHTLPLSHVFGQFMGLWIPPILAAQVHFEDRLLASDLIRQLIQSGSRCLRVPRVLDLLRDSSCSAIPISNAARTGARISALKRWWLFRDIHRLMGLKSGRSSAVEPP